MQDEVTIVVYGKAQPAGSKRAFTPRPGAQPIIVDANPKSRPWKTEVSHAAAQTYDGDLMDGALALEATFYEPRPKAHYGTGKNAHVLKATAPMFPTKVPDTTKLVRGIEDAMTGIVYRDDSQIVEQHNRKMYGEPARCEITVRRMAQQTVGEQVPDEQLSLAAA